LHKHHEQFLKRLFPTYEFEKNPVKFPTVQHQPNNNDCGVFAIAFATSLLFNVKPEKVKYEHEFMRSHLIKILETNVIEHFPQDPQYGYVQKVLPLAVIRAKEAEAIRIHTMRQHETEQQKSNRLKKLRDTYVTTKKQLNKRQLMPQSIIKERNVSQDILKKKIQNASKKILEKKIINIQIKQNKCSKTIYQDLENNCDIQLTQNILKEIDTKEQNIQIEQNEHNNCSDSYKKDLDLDSKRARKRRLYEQDLENNRAKKRRRYQQDIENNRVKQMHRYKNKRIDIKKI